jgi:ribosomal protein S18 acetylase RimI-like enzyme
MSAHGLGGERMIAIRHMNASELDRIGEIDRSEHVTREYSYRCGSLDWRAVDVRVPPWSRSGDHEHSVRARVSEWMPILERGGTLIGAFDADTVAGAAIYRPHLEEGTANLSVLHVSRSHRRKGVASLLTGEVVRLARADGARRLYVSATPSDSAVGFYRRHGFEPTDAPNPELFALEPDDIHMVLEL